MYLQLAENLAEPVLPYVPYVWIPDQQNGGGFWMREDKLDSMMNDDEFDEFTEVIAPYEAEVMGMSENSPQYLAGKADRKARRAERQERKAAKKDTKQQKREAKVAIKQARASKKEAAGQAKLNKTAADREGTRDLIKSGIGTVGGLVGSIFGKGGEAGAEASADAGGAPDEDKKDNTMTYVMYGLGGLAILGIGYVLLKPKKS